MTAKNVTEMDNKEELVDDFSSSPIAKANDTTVNMDKMAALRAKQQAKQNGEKKASFVPKSLSFGIVGTGQGGGRLAASWAKLGYEAVAINTAKQDLKFLDLPDTNKLLINDGIDGAAKELSIGRAAAESHRAEIETLINNKLGESQVHILCLALGGGSGAGSCEVMVDLLLQTGKPLIVMCILPMDSEDAQSKKNALETLAKLTDLIQTKKLSNLICIDNAKLETIYQHVNPTEFFDVANKAIVSSLDAFNTYSAMPSSTKPLDPMELSKLLLDGEGLTVYGELTVSNFQDETAIAEAILDNLDGNLLASGFDLKQAKYAGVIIAANKEVWESIPSSSVNYAMTLINDRCQNPSGVFRGIYVVPMTENVVKVYSMFSGLALPDNRIEQLKKETKELSTIAKNKNEQRNLSLKLDTGTEENVSAAQKVKEKIASKSSNFGRFVSSASNVTDRRK
jgi:cell division GTPase FtsZ